MCYKHIDRFMDRSRDCSSSRGVSARELQKYNSNLQPKSPQTTSTKSLWDCINCKETQTAMHSAETTRNKLQQKLQITGKQSRAGMSIIVILSLPTVSIGIIRIISNMQCASGVFYMY